MRRLPLDESEDHGETRGFDVRAYILLGWDEESQGMGIGWQIGRMTSVSWIVGLPGRLSSISAWISTEMLLLMKEAVTVTS